MDSIALLAISFMLTFSVVGIGYVVSSVYVWATTPVTPKRHAIRGSVAFMREQLRNRRY